MPASVLVVRTREGADAWAAQDGRVRGGDAAAIEAALGPATLSPLAGEPADRLMARPAGDRERSDMASYFGVQTDHEPDGLLERLREVPAVEFAYVKPPVSMPVVPPSVLGYKPVTGPEPAGLPNDLSGHQ